MRNISHPNSSLLVKREEATKNNKKAFTIIEVIIGIFIFSLWLVSVFMLFAQSSKMTVSSKNTIIATNLARENIELLKNLRDFNFKTHRKFDWIPNSWETYNINSDFFTWATDSYYTIENKMWWDFPVEVKKLTSWSWQLYLTWENKYVYEPSSSNTETDFYRYLKFEEAKYMDWSEKIIPETYKVTSIVEWKRAGGWKIEIPFILANWKRL